MRGKRVTFALQEERSTDITSQANHSKASLPQEHVNNSPSEGRQHAGVSSRMIQSAHAHVADYRMLITGLIVMLVWGSKLESEST